LKGKIINSIASTVRECQEKGNLVEKENKVGDKKTFHFKVKTERVDREKLWAVSWVFPIHPKIGGIGSNTT
jgi:hypothetical protein